jgi:hypothetical protein
MEYLRSGGWPWVRDGLRRLEKSHRQATERKVADALAQDLSGIGPKQARNVLQYLGLTRYEVPLDSRVMKWLNDFGFPVHLSAQVLSDTDCYHLALDGVQALCREARILPCMLDAAIFSTLDRDWDDA